MNRSVSFVAALALCGFPPAGSAQPPPRSPAVRPWTPPGADTIQVWAAEARAAFRAQAADTVDADSKRGFDRVGSIAARFLRSLGRDRATEAAAVETALDSLGFDTDLVVDPQIPSFMLLMVRNPHRVTAEAMVFFYWYRGDRLMLQAMPVAGGQRPWTRVWWNNEASAPYAWGLVDRARDGQLGFYLLRMTEDGGFWRPLQWPGHGPDLGQVHEAAWLDLDGDQRPEFKTWSRAEPDSLFTECPSCPRRLIERTYAERGRDGFALWEQRMLPTPYATFTDFVRALIQKDRAAASRHVARSELVDQARRAGWGSRRAGDTWMLERTEQERWPRWLGLRFTSASGPRRYVVRFTERDGRWLIDSWTEAGVDSVSAQRRK